MPKKKRTRQQKIMADLRHNSVEEKIETVSLPLSSELPTVQKPSPVSISTSSYSYLFHDLWKTFFLTIFVVVVEVLLRYFVIK
jgi:hypothetical protein